MQGGIIYDLVCERHEDRLKGCDCVSATYDMVFAGPEEYPNMRHYIACVQAAVEHTVKLTRHFSDLVTVDRAVLSKEDPSLPFAFCVRELGTQLVRLTEHDGAGHMCYDYPQMIECFGDKKQWYWWNGSSMTAVPTWEVVADMLRSECDKRGITYMKLLSSDRIVR